MRFTVWGAATITLTLCLAVATSAQPPGGNRFDRFDRDHDGKLSRDEMPGFAEFDLDKDGYVSRQEAESFFRPGGPGGPGGRGAPGGGLGDPVQQSTMWIDPVATAPRWMTYHLFDTNARGKGTHGSYLIYLPPSYSKETTRRYPVIYWLHGGNNTARQGAGAVESIDEAVKNGLMPEAIVVSVQGLPVGWYANSVDGKRPVENVIIKDLIPHIDATYRTINRREARGIEGFSMGGYGALHLGMKYPELFGVISSVAPSILRNLSDEQIERFVDTFGGSQAIYDANGPWTLAEKNAPVLKKGTKIRLLSGDQDFRLKSAIDSLSDLLNKLEIPHQFLEVQGAGHQYDVIIKSLGDSAFAFWKEAFGELK